VFAVLIAISNAPRQSTSKYTKTTAFPTTKHMVTAIAADAIPPQPISLVAENLVIAFPTNVVRNNGATHRDTKIAAAPTVDPLCMKILTETATSIVTFAAVPIKNDNQININGLFFQIDCFFISLLAQPLYLA